MLGGLYGDLPPPSSASADDEKPAAPTVWSSTTMMAPPTLRKPAAAPFAPPHSVLKTQQAQLRAKASVSAAAAAPVLLEPVAESASFQPALVGIPSTVVDEYDPARPNDYEDYRREKMKRAKEAEMKRELERRRREEEEREREQEQREREREREREAQEREEREYHSRASSLNISGEEAWRRRASMSGAAPRSPSPPNNGEGFSIGNSTSAGLGLGAGGQMTAAQRMMAKMGWKEGQGLGKQEQGIKAPLIAKKTDRRGGVIVDMSNSKAEKKPKSVNFSGPPTRVLLLRNMVGPGEVDDELAEEVASECAKYGTVSRVLMFEITQPDCPAEEAVRIFIQFERAEEATKAMIDLEGRFFGGRVVCASFFDEERFGKNELAPTPGEIPGFEP